MIEQVEAETTATLKGKPAEAAKSPYQYYDERRVRPSSSSEVRPTHTPKGGFGMFARSIRRCL